MSLISKFNPRNWGSSEAAKVETIRTPDVEPVQCAQCGDWVEFMAPKCPHCGYKGSMSRKEWRQGAYGMTLVGLLIWPLLAIAPIVWLASWFTSKEGASPYKDVDRKEYLDRKTKSPP